MINMTTSRDIGDEANERAWNRVTLLMIAVVLVILSLSVVGLA
jgi:hypothetical protein